MLIIIAMCMYMRRLIPTGSDPTAHSLWRLAESYGATCRDRCSSDTTHVVSLRQGSDKTLWAAQQGVPVVSPAWLYCCTALWKKVPEKMFVLPLSGVAAGSTAGALV